MEVNLNDPPTSTLDPSENEVLMKNEIIQSADIDPAIEAKRKFFVNLLEFVYQDIYLFQEEKRYLNDVEIQCNDGSLRVPSLLLAAISPLFRLLGPVADLTDHFCLVMPDLKKCNLETFFKALCHLEDVPNNDETIDVLDSVMSDLCVEYQGVDETFDDLELFDQVLTPASKLGFPKKRYIQDENIKVSTETLENKENEPIKPKRKVGRKPGQKLNVKQEPYIKTEITDSHRTSAVYGLRTTVKRKRFTDEISEPSDLDIDDDEPEEYIDSSDEYAPDENEQKSIEEDESEDEDEMEDDILDEDSDVIDENDVLSSDDEIIDVSIGEKKEPRSKDHDSFTVKVMDDGTVEVTSQIDTTVSEGSSRKRGRPRKKPRMDDTELIGIGRVVSVMEDEDPAQLAFKGKKIYAAVKSDPKSLLKPSGQAPLPLILYCSVCEVQCNGQAELRHHAATNHKGSKFFVLPKNNPHRECVSCQALMDSYEHLVQQENPEDFNQMDVCFPCPHCRRRFLGHVGGLSSHLLNDHRNTIASDLGNKSIEYFSALKRSEPNVLTCDFCKKSLPHSAALNKHLISCPDNDSGCSAGLFCHICGKMFAQQRYLNDHVRRHGKDQVNRPRNFMCGMCPVTCVSEANLSKHIEREHSAKDPDQDFVLHENCQRCTALFQSYLDNKVTLNIPFREMVFKCPHCCMVLFANHKHAPRYLYNHIHKFHTDPDINDFTLGGEDPSQFRLRSKHENDVLTCEFCGFSSKTRANHNVHLSTCKQSTVPCRPGYMCDSCGFIAGNFFYLFFKNFTKSNFQVSQKLFTHDFFQKVGRVW